MKLVSFSVGGTSSYGAVQGDGIVDLGKKLKYPTLLAAIKAGALDELKKAAAGASPDHKLSAVKLDSALLTRDAWRVELLTTEASRTDCIEGQTKQLSDMRKLARALKDQLDFIYARLPESQRPRTKSPEMSDSTCSRHYVYYDD